MISYRGWIIEYENELYKVWCDDILYYFATEDEVTDFIDRMIEKGCDNNE